MTSLTKPCQATRIRSIMMCLIFMPTPSGNFLALKRRYKPQTLDTVCLFCYQHSAGLCTLSDQWVTASTRSSQISALITKWCACFIPLTKKTTVFFSTKKKLPNLDPCPTALCSLLLKGAHLSITIGKLLVVTNAVGRSVVSAADTKKHQLIVSLIRRANDSPQKSTFFTSSSSWEQMLSWLKFTWNNTK